MGTGGRNGGPLVAAAWALALLGPGAGPLRAAPPPVTYLIDKVTAVGGNPIKEVEGGVIYQRLTGCEVTPQPVDLPKPLAGSLGDGVSLDLEILPCPGGAPPPTGECRLQVGGGAPVTFAVSGWKANLPVALPAATGVYGLSLRCSFSGQPEEAVFSALFVTFAKPVFPVSEPWQDWYRLACTWGAGVTVADPPSAVLEKILHGLHDQGQRYWRYGYCTRVGTLCIFGDTQLPFLSPDLTHRGGLGACKWWLLAGGSPHCNFTDCFGYSDLLRYISATFGIRVFALPPIKGAGKGFSSQGWLKALDPASGNLDCGYRGLGCAFLFGEHSLVRHDLLLYDATFGQIYRDLGGLIAQDIVSKENGVVILERSQACLLNRPPYGAFDFFRELPLRIERCPRDLDKPARFVNLDADLEAGAVKLESVEGDERPEVLTVQLDVNVDVAGAYQVFGALVGENREPVANRPGYRSQLPFSSARISGLPGLYRVELSFSGEDLVRSGVSQPYWIDATIVSDHGISDNVFLRLRRLSLEGLGEKSVRLEGIAGAERLQLTQGTVLRVSLPVDVRTAGTYAVAGYLSSGGRGIAESAQVRDLSPGSQTLEVDFPAEEIARQGLDGTYTVTVEVHSLDPETGAPVEVVDALTQEIGPFQASDFHSP